MEAAVLGAVSALLALAVVVVVWVARDALNTARQAGVDLVAAQKARAQGEADRDAALAAAKQAQVERDESRALAANLEQSLAAARAELTKYVQTKLAGASDADVAAELDRLLGQQLPAVRPAGATAGAGDGAPRPGPVHPA